MTYCLPDQPAPQQPDRSPIEAVVVCSHYDDFLRHTLPSNKFLFDKIVVVTDWEDKQTRRLCEFYHVECCPTDLLDTRKGVFNKGKGINEGLAILAKGGWVVHLDADMWLPPQTRLLLQQANLDKSMVYGIDRFNVRGLDKWLAFIQDPHLQHECDAYVHLKAFPLGTRVMQTAANGYLPIGFFQMWHPLTSNITRYPEQHSDV